MATINGTPGDDVLTGTEFDDEIRGEGGNDELRGLAGADLLNGGSGNDLLDGGDGSDTAVYAGADAAVTVDLSLAGAQNTGGAGTDTLISIENLSGSSFADTLTGNAGANVLVGNAGSDTLNGGAGDDTLEGEDGQDTLNGGEGSDTLSGGASADTLDGGAGADDMSGGTGSDFYRVNDVGDSVVELADQGANDEVRSSITYTLTANVEDLFLTGSASIDGTGNELANRIVGNSGSNALAGAAGDDTLEGRGGSDSLDGGDGSDTASYAAAAAAVTVDLSLAGPQDTGGDGTDTLTSIENLTGSSFADTLTGNAGANILTGNAGSDSLDGGAGADVMLGGAGNDSYRVQDAGDSVEELADQGNDEVRSSITYTLTANVETLFLTGSANLGGTGNDLANSIVGNSGNNALAGAAGDDTLRGGDGDDSLDGGTGIDTASYAGAAAAVTVDLSLAGPQDTGGAGTDTLTSIENLTGSDFVDTLTGNAGANILSGNAGGDFLDGGAGNDRLNGEQGQDTLDGGDGNDVLVGGEGADLLRGGAGNDLLAGGAGTEADEMHGGTGDDNYFVDDPLDSVHEEPGEGVDTVRSSVSFVLPVDFERLVLTGTDAIDGTGNDADNQIYGNSGANALNGGNGNDYLHGGAGVDVMTGGLGDDRYIVDNSSDQVIESSSIGGFDTVRSSVSYEITGFVEMLVLFGSANVNATGNGRDNILFGNSGNNLLNGAGGADSMRGLGGNDTYTVNDIGDRAIESSATGGDDRVNSSVSFTLGTNVERLVLTGTAATDGTGNAIDNIIYGNNSDNFLQGREGDDSLYGRAGNDRLYGGEDDDYLRADEGDDWVEGGAGFDRAYGGTGADQFVFRDGDFSGVTSSTCDQIRDFSQAENDLIRLSYVDADTGVAGDQRFDLIGTDAFTGTAGELRYQHIAGDTFIQGDTNGDGAADFMIRLEGEHALTVGDFLL